MTWFALEPKPIKDQNSKVDITITEPNVGFIGRPQVYIEEPRRLTVPIIISHYREKTPNAVQTERRKKWTFKKSSKDPPPKQKQTTICRWYRKRRAQRQLKKERERELKREREEILERERRKREEEVFKLLKEQQKYEVTRKASPAPAPKVTKSVPAPKAETKIETKTVKKVYKGKAAHARPQTEARYVTVKRYNRYESLSTRFVNFCYRVCCQFYCCLTCLLIITFVVIIVI